MKITFATALWTAVLALMTAAPSSAMTPLALDGNEYRVSFWCSDSVGDYCDKGTATKDTFIFDDDKFILESFEDELFGLSAKGSYDEDGLSFTADFEVITDEIVDKYHFVIKGITLLSTLLFGSAEITYSKLKLTWYDEKDKATAYFFGIKD